LFGFHAAGAGDIDRDGFADFAIVDKNTSGMCCSALDVYRGSSTGAAASPTVLDRLPGAGFGTAIAGL
jgi:hypothetical protein